MYSTITTGLYQTSDIKYEASWSPPCSIHSEVHGDTKKGNFWKAQQKLKKSKKKKLLTEIEPLQLAV